MRKVRWGVLGAAHIATVKVIPGMQRGELVEVAAIASRDPDKARRAAQDLGIPKAYGSYEELLRDPEIDAVYNPLPNHLHVPWSIRAAEAGKHVLCEKPVAMNAAEVRELIAARDRTGMIIGEAFMVCSHPQWPRTMELVRSGRIGQLRSAIGSFSYFKLDPENIRNVRKYGGGALMDIGCYPIKTSRMVFGDEPVRVAATIMRDPRVDNVDCLTSAVLEYPSGQCVLTCSTQLADQQSMRFYGTHGNIELAIPFTPTPDRPASIRVTDASGDTVETFAPDDQYTLQGNAFSRAIQEGGAPPTPLEDAERNMAVIDAIFRAAESGRWEQVR